MASRLLSGALSLLAFSTAAVSVSVTPLRSQGRLKWRYRIAASYIPVRPAIAKDGTVYAVDTNGTLHALHADGKLKWTVASAGNRGVDVGGDGIIYTGDPTKVQAFHPNGTLKWKFVVSPAGHTLLGPNVGPDGNIYANASSGLGMFSLTPAGKLRWATPNQATRPWINNQELVFRPASKSNPLQVIYSAHAVLAQVDCSNGKITQVSTGGNSTQAPDQPALGPNGDLYSIGGLDLRAFQPDTTLRWYLRSNTFNTFSNPTVGADGIIYVVQSGSLLHALRPQDGSKLWSVTDPSWMLRPMVSPTNKTIVISGSTQWNMPYVRALDMKGKTLWQVDMGVPLQTGVRPMTPVRFTPDGKSAYVGTTFDTRQCFLYAFDTDTVHRGQAWTFGESCVGISRKYPQLGFRGRPALGGTLSVDLSDAGSSTPILYMLGFASLHVEIDRFGSPGCRLYVFPALLIPASSDSSGGGTTALPLPAVPALAGLQLFHQYVIADPVNRSGIVSTNGGGSVLGL